MPKVNGVMHLIPTGSPEGFPSGNYDDVREACERWLVKNEPGYRRGFRAELVLTAEARRFFTPARRALP